MRTRDVGVLAPLALLVLAGCSRTPDLDTRTFELRYLDPGVAADLIDPYVFGDRPEAPGMLSWADNAISVRETPDNLDKIARVLERYDVPRPSVRLHFKIIQADGFPTTDSSIADIEQVLRTLFRFRGYRLVAEALAAGMEGSTLNQVVGQAPHRYGIRAHLRDIRSAGDSGTVQFDVQLMSDRGQAMETLVTLPAGQTAVLGNAQLETEGGQIILTVRPELVRR